MVRRVQPEAVERDAGGGLPRGRGRRLTPTRRTHRQPRRREREYRTRELENTFNLTEMLVGSENQWTLKARIKDVHGD